VGKQCILGYASEQLALYYVHPNRETMKKYILFDNDGVLVETEHWYYMANKRALEEIGIDLSLDVYLDNMSQGISAWELAKAAGIDPRAIDVSRAHRNQYYQDYLISEDIEISGVVETLNELAPNYRMAIITTSKRDDFELIHRNRSIVDYMDFVLTREDYGQSKPHPEPYLSGLNRFGALASEAIVVEDSARGLKAAVAAEIDCIVVKNEFTASHDFSSALLKIESLKELPSALEGLKS